MKQLKKMIVLAVLAVVMTVMSGTDAKAGQVNTTETLVWGKGYTVDIVGGGNYQLYDVKLPSSGKFTVTLNITDDHGFGTHGFCVSDESGKGIAWDKMVENGMYLYEMELLAGSYTLKIQSCVIADLDGSFVPNFTPSNETVSESCRYTNNQLTTASSHTVGSKTKAHFAINDDIDVYKVKINKAGYITVNFNNDIAAMNMTMACGEKGIQYTENNIPFGRSSYKYFVPKGTYYFSFTRVGSKNTGTYTFSTKLSGLTTSKVRAAKNVKGKKAKITWAKKSDVDGYQVQVATNKKFTQNRKSKEISGQNASNYTFTKLKKGKTYYARVRTYKLANGKKVYSDWSAAKAVKIRK